MGISTRQEFADVPVTPSRNNMIAVRGEDTP